LSVTPNVNVHTLQSIHDMVCELKIRYEVDGGRGVLNEAWRGIDMVYITFYKKLMGLESCAANACVAMELERVGLIRIWNWE